MYASCDKPIPEGSIQHTMQVLESDFKHLLLPFRNTYPLGYTVWAPPPPVGGGARMIGEVKAETPSVPCTTYVHTQSRLGERSGGEIVFVKTRHRGELEEGGDMTQNAAPPQTRTMLQSRKVMGGGLF